MTNDLGQRAALRTSTALYWILVVVTALTGALVVVPFYVYGIPVDGAGDLSRFDVKLYWPFALDGAGGVVHNACILLAFVAPLLVPATLVWSALRFLGATTRRWVLLWPAALALLVLGAYAWHWKAILAWHLD